MSNELIPVVLPTEVAEQHEKAGSRVLADARLMTCESSDEFELTQEFRRQIRHAVTNILQEVNPVVDAAHRAHLAATALRTRLTANFSDADRVLEGKQRVFTRKQREAEEILRAQQLAETKRLEVATRKELAEELEKAGEPEQAAQVLAAPIAVRLPTTPSLVPPGVRQLKKIKSIDLIALAQFVCDRHPHFDHFIEAVEAKIKKFKIDNPNSEIPGVEFELEDSIPVKK